MDVDKLLKTNNEMLIRFCKKHHINRLSLFGSTLRGGVTDKSDIDLLVEFDEPVGFFTFLDLEEYLEGILGLKVDLVSKKALKPRIGKYILEELIQV